MNTDESIDAIEPVPVNRPWTKVLKVVAGIARWTWRVAGILVTLFALGFILIGLSQQRHLRISTDPEDLAAIGAGVVLFAALILAWWREWLGGLIILFVVSACTAGAAFNNWRHTGKFGTDQDKGDFVLFVLPSLMLLSWSLRTINNSAAGPRTRRLALVAAPLLAVTIVLCVLAMFHAPFNP